MFVVIVRSPRKSDKSRWLAITGRGNKVQFDDFETAQEEADYNNMVYLGDGWSEISQDMRPYQVCEL